MNQDGEIVQQIQSFIAVLPTIVNSFFLNKNHIWKITAFKIQNTKLWRLKEIISGYRYQFLKIVFEKMIKYLVY